MKGPASRLARGTLVAAAVVAFVSCGGGMGRPQACDDFTALECQEAVLIATRAVPAAVMARPLVEARVERRDAAEPGLCQDWSVCEPADAVAIVWLTYPGPAGDESWPVAVVRPAAGAAMIAAKPFPDALDARP